jgi:hypothetical protein
MRQLFLIAACFGIVATASTMTREEVILFVSFPLLSIYLSLLVSASDSYFTQIAVQSSKYEKYKEWITDISATQQYWASWIELSLNDSAAYCDLSNGLVPGGGEDSGCNRTMYMVNECNCTNLNDEDTCNEGCDFAQMPWCLPQFESSSFYPVLCDPYSSVFMPMSVCGPYVVLENFSHCSY